jgi:hypothetical protein
MYILLRATQSGFRALSQSPFHPQHALNLHLLINTTALDIYPVSNRDRSRNLNEIQEAFTAYSPTRSRRSLSDSGSGEG